MDQIQHSKPVPPFVKFCAANIPMVFDDSLSYYECLCALWKWLQTDVIDVINNNASVTELWRQELTTFENNVTDEIENFETEMRSDFSDLNEAFETLKSWIDNYFDNLDVQEEINNKLDEMAEQGVLADIISQYLNSTAIFAFDNVAGMKSSINLIDGSYAKTLGYYSKNDGGAATYRIREITNDDVVDEKFIIEMNDGQDSLVAELITNDEPINICTVGGQQNTAQVINYLIGLGKKIYIPTGDFTIESTIEVNQDDVEIICDGNISSTTVTNYFNITRSNCNIKLNGTITGYEVSDVPIPTLITIGSDTYHTEYNSIYIKKATGFEKGIYTYPDNKHGVAYSQISFDYIKATYGIYIDSGSLQYNYVNENIFTGGRLESTYGIYFHKGANQTDPYNGNVFEHIAIEKNGIVDAINLDFASFNIFNGMRISEGLTGSADPIKIGNGSRDNIIQTKYQLKTSQISDSNTANHIRNYFECCLASDDLTRLGRKFYTYKGSIIMNDTDSFRNRVPLIANVNDTNEDSTEQLTSSEFIVNNGTIVKLTVSYGSVNKVFKLPKGLDVHGVDSFILLIPYKENGSTITVQDYDGNTILSSTQIGTAKIQKQKYLVKYTGKGGVATNVYDWTLDNISA